MFRYVRQSGYSEHTDGAFAPSYISTIISVVFVGSEETVNYTIKAAAAPEAAPAANVAADSNSSLRRKEVKRGLTLTFCFIGLQVSYLTWGVLQEKIMTRTYR